MAQSTFNEVDRRAHTVDARSWAVEKDVPPHNILRRFGHDEERGLLLVEPGMC